MPKRVLPNRWNCEICEHPTICETIILPPTCHDHSSNHRWLSNGSGPEVPMWEVIRMPKNACRIGRGYVPYRRIKGVGIQVLSGIPTKRPDAGEQCNSSFRSKLRFVLPAERWGESSTEIQ
jgi:hypothetical protein